MNELALRCRLTDVETVSEIVGTKAAVGLIPQAIDCVSRTYKAIAAFTVLLDNT